MASCFSAVDNCVQRLGKLEELIQSGSSSIIDVAADVEASSSTNSNKKSKDLYRIIAAYAELDREIKHWKKAVGNTKKSIVEIQRQQDSGHGNIKFAEMFQDVLAEVKKIDAKKDLEEHPLLKHYNESIWKIKRQREGGILEETSEDGEVLISCPVDNDMVCPLTKTEMEDPVQNVVCGHNYSRKAVEAHIKRMGAHARCPVIGCVNMIKMEELEPNKILELLIRRKNKGD